VLVELSQDSLRTKSDPPSLVVCGYLPWYLSAGICGSSAAYL